MIETINKLMRVQKQLVQEIWTRAGLRKKCGRNSATGRSRSRGLKNGPATNLIAIAVGESEENQFRRLH